MDFINKQIREYTLNDLLIVIFFSVWSTLLTISILNYIPATYDDSDDSLNHKRSGMIVRTDYKTGIQYLESTSGYLIKRGK